MNAKLEKAWGKVEFWVKQAKELDDHNASEMAFLYARSCACDVDKILSEMSLANVKSSVKKVLKAQELLKVEKNQFYQSYYSLSDYERSKLFNQDGDVRLALEA